MAKNIKYILIILMTIFVSGCGYHLGSISHPQIKSIAIYPIVNDTIYPNASEALRTQLCEAFQKDGTWKIRNPTTADCILYGRITRITLSSSSQGIPEGQTVYVTNQYNLTMDFEYTIVIPGHAEPLFSTTRLSENVQFQSPGDMYKAQQSGIMQASYQIARDVLYNCTAGW